MAKNAKLAVVNAPAPEAEAPRTNDTRLRDFNKQLLELGKVSAEGGVLAKPTMALAIVKAATDNIIGEADAEKTYDRYLEGRTSILTNAKKLAVGGIGAGDDIASANSRKANVSKNLQLIKAAVILKGNDTTFHDVLTTAAKLREDILTENNKAEVKPVFDVFVDCARAQKKSEVPLTDDEIRGEIYKPEAAEKSDLDRIIGLYKSARKLAEEIRSTGLDNAVVELIGAITTLGGDVPPVTDAEKEAAKNDETEKAKALLKKLGFQIVK